jgi:D-alanyl-D-alanine carboxypeptidase
MFAPVEDIKIKSIYPSGDLPKNMARCTPDMLNALQGAAADVKTAGGELILSDLYRSYDMQLQAHLDYVTGKKKAFSPPPGGSMHEAGRAFDLDLSSLKMKLSDFWKIAAKHQFATNYRHAKCRRFGGLAFRLPGQPRFGLRLLCCREGIRLARAPSSCCEHSAKSV